MTRSEETLVRIAKLKDEIESKTEEIKSLEKELKENSQREARRIMMKRKRRASKMASFIKHNSSRTIIIECTGPEFDGGEYRGESIMQYICKPNELRLEKVNDEWVIKKFNEFAMLLECVDNIYVRFE